MLLIDMGNKMASNLKIKLTLIIAIGFLVFVLVYGRFQPVSQLPSNEECIASFDTFAFTFPDRDGPTQEKIQPLSPWEAISVLPEIENLPQGWVSGKLEVVAVRSKDSNLEIWVSNPRSRKNFVYLIYSVNTQEWLQIPIVDTSNPSTIDNVHISNDQSVWRITINDGKLYFSVFDDISKHFVENYSQAIPSTWGLNNKSRTNSAFENIQTIWDANDIFWIFSGNDTIYNFDPAKVQFNRLTSLEGTEYIDTLTYDLKETIFIDFTYIDGEPGVMQYNISEDHLEEVSLPNWLVSSISLVDSQGNLWLRNGYGWRTPDEKWKRFHPNPINYWWHQDFLDDWRYHSLPDPVMQTSDGRIWFVIYRSEEWKTLRSGIAWFDPNTKVGCWFTSEGAQIIEDSQQNLWIMIEKTLYKYEYNS